jgi:L-lactate utilization protein LutB
MNRKATRRARISTTMRNEDAEYRSWLWRKLGEDCLRNLKKNGFDAHFFEGDEEARDAVVDMVSQYGSFGFGGSATTHALEIPGRLLSMGKEVLDHNHPGISAEQSLDTRYKQLGCDCFLCSANAIAATGEIVNVDGVGNRTASMTFGPGKVVVIAGMNKVTPDLDSALKRIREVAAPMRAKSLGIDTPCAKTGICNDCRTPSRICNVTTILHRRPALTDVSVVLVNRSLGF